MEIILRENKTDDEMIDIVTVLSTGKEALWAVVHTDFIYGEDTMLEEILKNNGEVIAKLLFAGRY